jgi:3-dehydroquinate synthetase/diketogulonate reductase-like aldo/keto reductase
MYSEKILRYLKESCDIEYTKDYRSFFNNFTKNSVVFIDEVVYKLYGLPFEDPLLYFITPQSDNAKTIEYYTHVIDEMGKNKVDSHTTIVSIGGGSVSNLAGFVAVTYKRGVKFVSVPTTLLAMVDACISFKQAINTNSGKNQIGLYKVPSKIIIDTCFLKTLEQRFISDGYAEIIKHAVCESIDILEHDDVILSTIKLKINHIKDDPWELHPILMYGHQIGHAIEYLSGDRYYHGEAVNIGMIGTSFIEGDIKLHKKLSERYGLPKTFSTNDEFTLTQVIDFMYNDKSVKNGKVHYYLSNKEVPVTDEQIRKSINYVCRDRYLFKNGYEMPKLVFGTYDIKPNSVYEAIKCGYRAIDCAYYYQNEEMIGQEIKRAINDGICTRENLFIIGKLWNNQHDIVESACKQSLKLLGLEYFDLYLIHWPIRYTNFEDEVGSPIDVRKVFGEMKKIEGTLCRNIGVSNFDIEHLEGIDPVVNQIEFHPYYRNEKLKKYCDSRGILTMGYSPMSPTFCKEHSPRESIQWILQEGASVVVKSNNPLHIKENLNTLPEIVEDAFEKKIIKTIKYRA